MYGHGLRSIVTGELDDFAEAVLRFLQLPIEHGAPSICPDCPDLYAARPTSITLFQIARDLWLVHQPIDRHGIFNGDIRLEMQFRRVA